MHIWKQPRDRQRPFDPQPEIVFNPKKSPLQFAKTPLNPKPYTLCTLSIYIYIPTMVNPPRRPREVRLQIQAPRQRPASLQGLEVPVTPITYSLLVITPYLVAISHKAVGNWGHRLGLRV